MPSARRAIAGEHEGDGAHEEPHEEGGALKGCWCAYWGCWWRWCGGWWPGGAPPWLLLLLLGS